MKLEVSDDGGVVISIEVLQESARLRKIRKTCSHMNVKIDEARTEVECATCGLLIHPVWWIGQLVEHWALFQRQQKAWEEAAARYEAKSRTKCQHCGKITRVVKPPKAVPVDQDATKRKSQTTEENS